MTEETLAREQVKGIPKLFCVVEVRGQRASAGHCGKAGLTSTRTTMSRSFTILQSDVTHLGHINYLTIEGIREALLKFGSQEWTGYLIGALAERLY